MLIKLAYKSLLDRKSAVILSVISITIGIMLLISFNYIKDQVKTSFSKTISGIDLIVGAKTSDVNLLLNSVFHIGNATDNISWKEFQSIKTNDKVKWAIPISLGDSHRRYRVIGTEKSYFSNYQYGNKKSLQTSQGHWFDHPFDVVIGHEVAKTLNYAIDDKISLSHGVGKTSFKNHDQIQFKIKGILSQTGTPIDQSLFISLFGLEAVHLNWPKSIEEQKLLTEHIVNNGLPLKSVTAAFITLKNKSATFVMQRQINQIKTEPLQAILPGVALAQLWKLSKTFETVLWLVGSLVFISTIIGLVNMLITSLQFRKKELALLRIIGASPLFCFLLIQIESLLVVLTAIVLATLSIYAVFFILGSWLSTEFGFFIDLSAYWNTELLLILLILILLSISLVCIPAIMFYRQSSLKNINQ